MRVAVVHDYFTQLGGAERVAEELYHMLPGSKLFSTVALPNGLPEGLRDVSIETSWMQGMPGMAQLYRLYFPLYPFAVRSLDLSRFDLVVSSSSGYVKGVQVNPDALHVCYCHTPMRWVWSLDAYSARESFGRGTRAVIAAMIRGLRAWDTDAARQPDHFIANSKSVAARIERAYGRYSEVILLPVDTDRFRLPMETGDHYLVLARLVSYKRIDVAVKAFANLGKNLIVVGSGPALESLQAQGGPTVQFVGRVSDSEVEALVSRSKALIFPGEEDLGIAPLELAAAGRPTIAYRAGGATETVVEGLTGVFFDEQTPESLADAVERFEQLTWSPETIRQHALGFSREVFQERMLDFLQRVGAPLPNQHRRTFAGHSVAF